MFGLRKGMFLRFRFQWSVAAFMSGWWLKHLGRRHYGIGITMTMDTLGDMWHMWCHSRNLLMSLHTPLEVWHENLVNDSTEEEISLRCHYVQVPVLEFARSSVVVDACRTQVRCPCCLVSSSLQRHTFFFGGFEVEGNWQTYNCSCKDIVVKHFWAIKWKIFASKHFPKDPSSTGYLSHLGGVVKLKCRECLRLLFGSGDWWWLAGGLYPFQFWVLW